MVDPMTDLIEALQGGVFVFKIGADKKPYSIHRKVIENISPVLSKLMNNEMKEGLEGVAVLPDVDTQTFSLFCRYAYVLLQPLKENSTLHRQCTVCNTKVTEGSVLLSTFQQRQYCAGCYRKVLSKLHLLNGRRELQFNSYILPANVRRTYFKAFNAASTLYPANATELMDHARLFMFADTYLIEWLKALSLSSLDHLIKTMPLSESSVLSIVALVTLVYKEADCHTKEIPMVFTAVEPPQATCIQRQDLRSLILIAVSVRAKDLMELVTFRDFMAKGGRFVADFLQAISLQ